MPRELKLSWYPHVGIQIGHQGLFSTFHDPRQILCKVCGLISINGGWSFPYISIPVHLRSDRFLSSGYFRLGSCRPNLSRFWAVNNLTELLKKSKNLLLFCSPRQWPFTNQISVFLSNQSWDNEAPQPRQFWDEDLIRAVSTVLNQVVHSFYRFLWVMGLGRKI